MNFISDWLSVLCSKAKKWQETGRKMGKMVISEVTPRPKRTMETLSVNNSHRTANLNTPSTRGGRSVWNTPMSDFRGSSRKSQRHAIGNTFSVRKINLDASEDDIAVSESYAPGVSFNRAENESENSLKIFLKLEREVQEEYSTTYPATNRSDGETGNQQYDFTESLGSSYSSRKKVSVSPCFRHMLHSMELFGNVTLDEKCDDDLTASDITLGEENTSRSIFIPDDPKLCAISTSSPILKSKAPHDSGYENNSSLSNCEMINDDNSDAESDAYDGWVKKHRGGMSRWYSFSKCPAVT